MKMFVTMLLSLACFDTVAGTIHQEYEGPWHWDELTSKRKSLEGSVYKSYEVVAGWADSGTAVITGRKTPEADMTIPSKIDYHQGVTGPWGIYNRTAWLSLLTVDFDVTDVGDSAFAHCQWLGRVTMSDGLKRIGANAFFDCTNLVSATIPASVTNIDAYAFDQCKKLETIRIPEGVETIGMAAFQLCELAKITKLPTSLKYIGKMAFSSCYKMTAAIPTGVEYIGPFAFQCCIAIPEDTVIPSTVTRIGDGAFNGCHQLKTVTMPSSVYSVGRAAFYQCKAQVVFQGGPPAYMPDGEASSDYYPDTIGDKCVGYFKPEHADTWMEVIVDGRWNGMEMHCEEEYAVRFDANGGEGKMPGLAVPRGYKFALPANKFTRAGYTFVGWFTAPSGGTRVTAETVVTADVTWYAHWNQSPTEPDVKPLANGYGYTEVVGDYTWTFSVINGEVEIGVRNQHGVVQCQCAVSPSPSGTLKVPETLGGCPVVSLGYYALHELSSVTAVVLPSSLREIGKFALRGCWRLASMEIPANVAVVGYDALAGCDALFVTVSDGNPWFSTVDGALYDLKRTDLYFWPRSRPIELPTTLRNIRSSACRNNFAMEDAILHIPVGVTNIADNAFEYCQLNGVELNEGLFSIGWSAFADNESLSSIVIPSTVAALENDVFYGCTNLFAVYFNGNAPRDADLEVYNGTPEDMVSFVRPGSTGWASEGSASLPDAWPVLDPEDPDYGSQRMISFWKEEPSPVDPYSPPEWTVVTQPETIIGYFVVSNVESGVLVETQGSKLAAFAANGECRGVAGVIDGPNGKLFSISIGVENSMEAGLTLKCWDAATGMTNSVNEYVIDASAVGEQIGRIVAPRLIWIGEKPAVQPQTHIVTFKLGKHGTHTGGGALTQSVEDGKAAAAPTFTVADGWEFVGWDKTFDRVTGDLTVTAQWKKIEADPIVDPEDPEDLDDPEVWRPGEAGEIAALETTLTGTVSWGAKNLPKGLKIDAKTGVISGTPTAPGSYVVRVTAKSGRETETFDVEVTVGHYVDESLPLDGNYEALVGVKTRVELGGDFAGCKATGLPAGLKFAAKDLTDKTFGEIAAGTVYGVPTKACTNSVVFTYKEGKVTHSASATFAVAGIPAWSVGTFNGRLDNGSGSATLTVAANGKISGKVATGGKTWTFSSSGYDMARCGEDGGGEVTELSIAATAKNGKQTADVSLGVWCDNVSGGIAGEDIDVQMELWRSPWKDKDATGKLKPYVGLYTVQLAGDGVGTGYLSLTVDAKGNCKATGKLPDGTSASGTLPLVWNDEDDAPMAIWQLAPSAYKGGYVGGCSGGRAARTESAPCR